MQFLIDETTYTIRDEDLRTVILAMAPEFLKDIHSSEAKTYSAERIILKGAVIPFKRIISKYLKDMVWKGDILSNLTTALISAVIEQVTKEEWQILTYDMDGVKQVVGLRPRASVSSFEGARSQDD